jgi:hypothetical protein
MSTDCLLDPLLQNQQIGRRRFLQTIGAQSAAVPVLLRNPQSDAGSSVPWPEDL